MNTELRKDLVEVLDGEMTDVVDALLPTIEGYISAARSEALGDLSDRAGVLEDRARQIRREVERLYDALESIEEVVLGDLYYDRPDDAIDEIRRIFREEVAATDE